MSLRWLDILIELLLPKRPLEKQPVPVRVKPSDNKPGPR